jgi:hypothetical protein
MDDEYFIQGKFTPLYAYGHRVMPDYLAKKGFIQKFLTSPIIEANKVWYMAYKLVTGFEPPPYHLKVVTSNLPDNTPAYVTLYPEPENYLENLCSAVVAKGSLVYYFTYELTRDYDPDCKDKVFILGSWAAPGVHLNFGHSKNTSIKGFLAAIQTVIGSATPFNPKNIADYAERFGLQN